MALDIQVDLEFYEAFIQYLKSLEGETIVWDKIVSEFIKTQQTSEKEKFFKEEAERACRNLEMYGKLKRLGSGKYKVIFQKENPDLLEKQSIR